MFGKSSRVALLGAGGLATLFGIAFGCSTAPPLDEELGATQDALTAEQCTYFKEGNSVTFCHAANLKKGKFVLLTTNTAGCINGHAGHQGDFISLDGTCNNSACLPAGAPTDVTLHTCCDNSSAVNGHCACDAGYTADAHGVCTAANLCAGVTCAASDACHVAGTCDPSTGHCSSPNAANGTACEDGNACTTGDACAGGTCVGGAAPSCDDGNGCTDDSCDPGSGCVHSNNTAPCDDGDACTTGDACSGGVCVGGAPTTAPSPVHQWTFNDGTANDSIGGANGALLGGATISGGRLIVDNTLSSPNQSSSGQRMNAPLPDTVAAKTLVAWVSLANLTQHGGSALSVESTTSNPFAQRFDAIDYAERTSSQWMSGSDNFLRSPVSNGGAPETSTGEVMVAIVYDTDNSITIYRDGQPYAASYVQGALQTYSGGASDALIGLRHSGCSNNCWLSGSIDEARVYNVPLSLCQIRTLQPVP